jgi:hypothetical protein
MEAATSAPETILEEEAWCGNAQKDGRVIYFGKHDKISTLPSSRECLCQTTAEHYIFYHSLQLKYRLVISKSAAVLLVG